MAEAKIEIILSNGARAGETLKELTKTANSLNKELGNLKPGTEAFINKSKDINAVKDRMKDVKQQIEGTTSASNFLKKAWESLPGAGFFNQVGKSLNIVKGGVGGLISNFGVLKTAIASTGIGLLVVALGALFNYFSKIEAVTNILKGAWDGLTAAFNVFTKAVATFDFSNLGENMATAAKEGYNLVQVFDELEDKQRELDLANEQSGLVIDQLLLRSKNVQLSFKERIDLLDQASKIELENHKNKLAYAKEYEAAVQREVDNAERQNEANDELKDKLIEAKKAVINADRESITLQEKVANRRSALEEKELAAQEKRAEAARKQREEEKKAFLEQQKEEADAAKNIEDLKVSLMKEGLDKQIKQIELDTARKMQALKGSDQQIIDAALLLEEEKEKRIQAARDANKKAQDEKDATARKEKEQKDLAALELELATEQNVISEQRLNNEITNQEFAEQTAQNALDFQAQKLELLKAAHGEESAEYQRAYGEYLRMQQAQADAAVEIKKKEMEEQVAAMQGGLGFFGNFFGALAGMQKQGTEQWKAFATTQAIISTIQSSINAYQSTAAIPIIGPVLAPVAAALALATGYANVKKIQATKVEPPTKPKARRGMVLHGATHEQGGIPIEAENEEIIMTAGVYRNPYLRRMASQINVAAGGVSFDTPKYAGGGVPSQAAVGGFDTGNLEKLLMANIDAINARIDRIQVINDVTKTQEGINVINQIKEEADV